MLIFFSYELVTQWIAYMTVAIYCEVDGVSADSGWLLETRHLTGGDWS